VAAKGSRGASVALIGRVAARGVQKSGRVKRERSVEAAIAWAVPSVGGRFACLRALRRRVPGAGVDRAVQQTDRSKELEILVLLRDELAVPAKQRLRLERKGSPPRPWK
jgi:hypothetical protein